LVEVSNKNQELATALANSTTEVETMKKELVEAKSAVLDFDNKVIAAAQDMTAAQGILPVIVIPEDKTKEELMATLAALPQNERFAFFQRNSEKLKEEIVKGYNK